MRDQIHCSSLFTYNSSTRVFIVEASTLSMRDALCIERFGIKSKKTGKVVYFTAAEPVYQNFELAYWIMKPALVSLTKDKSLRGLEVHVFNT